MSARVSLVVPGLEGPAAGGGASAGEAARALLSGLDLPGFSALMRHATFTRMANHGGTLEQMATSLLGLPVAAPDAFPAGALSRASLGAAAPPPSGVWLRADPVHLRADMGKLTVFPPDVMSLSLDQSSRILGWLNAQALFPGPPLELVTATCWVCPVERAPGMDSVSPRAAYGASATEVMVRGGEAAGWHARMNEVQMLLHRCPVNEERERDGLAPVNSLWYWGEGPLPPAPAAPAGVDAVHGDDPVIVGAARVAGVAVRPSAARGDAWCTDPETGHHLVAHGALELPARGQDLDTWRDALCELDGAWLEPLAGALDAGRLSAVDLHVMDGVVHARRARFWQRLLRSPGAAEGLGRLREALGR